MDDREGKKYLEMCEALTNDKSQYVSFWQEIAENVFPFRATFGSPGVVRPSYRKVYDGTPMWSLGMLAAAIHAFMTNPAVVWANVAANDENVARSYEAVEYGQIVDRFMFNVFLRSNFYAQIHEGYTDLSAFGNMALWMEPDPKTVMRYISIPMSDIVWDVNEREEVDTCIRAMRMTPRQIVAQFPKERIPKKVADAFAHVDRCWTDKFDIIQVVRPRKERSPLPVWHKLARPFESVYVMKDGGHVLDVGGYYEFPLAAGRWAVRSGEKYGYGPGAQALPNSRTLHMMQKHTLRAAQRATDPPIMMPHRAFMGPLDLSAGGVNYYNKSGMAALKGGANLVQPFPQGQAFQVSHDEKESLRMMVQRDFYVDRLQVREADRMSAAEIYQRAQENNRHFAPVFGRLHPEVLEPIVQRTFMEGIRRGLIPKPPQSMMERGGLRVKINSPIAKQQGIAEVQALVSAVDVLTPLANAKPEILNALNESKLTEFVFKSFGAPLEVIHNPEEYMKALKADQEQKNQLAVQGASAENAAAMAGAIKDIAGATKDMGGLQRVQGMMM